ncbi:hypothetical protein Moror_15882 [Moniliophthora roreri MCA 2997]|uniref:Uncharacterized protein n=1 Tax=Moniliophthora roreri (strain MCA 2997) TaxID=1381753 RepID=V2WH62_MONRO|nr:hypothetical protein Moror_15882 [Moniliophthora roreri MCA 2997]
MPLQIHKPKELVQAVAYAPKPGMSGVTDMLAQYATLCQIHYPECMQGHQDITGACDTNILALAREWAQEVADSITTSYFNQNVREEYLRSRTVSRPGLLQETETYPEDQPMPYTWHDPWFFTLHKTSICYWHEQQKLRESEKLLPLEDPKHTVVIPHPVVGGHVIGYVQRTSKRRVHILFDDKVTVVINSHSLWKVFQMGDLGQSDIPLYALIVGVDCSIVSLKATADKMMFTTHCNMLSQVEAISSDVTILPMMKSMSQVQPTFVQQNVPSESLTTGRALWIGMLVQIMKTVMKGLAFEVEDVYQDPDAPSGLTILVKQAHLGQVYEKQLDYSHVQQYMSNLFLPIPKNLAWQL